MPNPIPDVMRAAVIGEESGPFVLRDLPVPRPGRDEVLVRVRACAVDRFDTAIRSQVRERGRLPLILGHEIAGEVAGIGRDVDRWKPGDRVVTSLYLVCGRCRWCLRGRETICERFAGHVGVDVPGGYAEYTVLPARNLVELPDSVGYPEGSLIANAIGTPFHAFTARMRLQAGEVVIVTGAGGGVGLHALQLVRLLGAEAMGVDVGPVKQEAMTQAGAVLTVDPRVADLAGVARDWTDGRGVDGVLELVGPATLPSTLSALSKGGRLVIVGSHTGSEWTLDPGLVYRNEWEILGSRNVTVDELGTVVRLVADGRVRPIVDRIASLDDVEALHARVRAGEVVGRDVLIP